MFKGLRFFLFFGTAVFSLVFIFTCLQGLVVENRFLHNPFDSTSGTITGMNELDHGKVYYEYTVEKSKYIGAGPYKSSLPGSRMKVFYLIADPSVSTGEDPSSGFKGIALNALQCAAAFAIVLTVAMLLLIAFLHLTWHSRNAA